MTSAHEPNPTSGTEPPVGEARPRLLPLALEFVAFSAVLLLLAGFWYASYRFAGLFSKDPFVISWWATAVGFVVVWLVVALRTEPRRGFQLRHPTGGWSLSASPEFVAFTAALIFLAAQWASPFLGPGRVPYWAAPAGFAAVWLLVALMWWPEPRQSHPAGGSHDAVRRVRRGTRARS